jgi:uncharacterized integral membrane protein (TIGR00698 family)
MSVASPVRSTITSTRLHAPGLVLIGSLVAIAFTVNAVQPAISPLALSVLLGFLVANLGRWPSWATAGTTLSSKRLMRIGVALLGMQLSLRTLVELGVRGVLAVLVVVSCTILGVIGLSRLFRMGGELGLLMGVGYGICGATAVAAVRSQTRATAQETSYAIAMITLCGTLSIVALPLLAGMLGLSDAAFGAWAGSAVHDVGQVVATASVRGDEALQAAVVVKLARVTMLAPVFIILSIRHRRYLATAGAVTGESVRVPWIPGFVLGFLVVVAINNTGIIPAGISHGLVWLNKILLAFGLAALGAGVRWRELRAIGPRPLAMGLTAWVLVGGVALGMVTLVGF